MQRHAITGFFQDFSNISQLYRRIWYASISYIIYILIYTVARHPYLAQVFGTSVCMSTLYFFRGHGGSYICDDLVDLIKD